MLAKQFPTVNNHIIARGPQTSAKQTYNKGFQTIGSIACWVHIISVFLLLTYHQLIHLHYLYAFEQLRKLYSGWHEMLKFWAEESQYGRCCRGRGERPWDRAVDSEVPHFHLLATYWNIWYLKGVYGGVAQAGLLVISDGDLRKIEFI